MQTIFDFAASDLSGWLTRFRAEPGRAGSFFSRRTPEGQLVKSLISSRTRDAVSLAAYRRIGARWGRVSALAAASVDDIEETIADVTFADRKARQLVHSLSMIGRERPDFQLDFLARLPLGDALAWLERLPGVGRKVAAATLNASTLARPVFIVDSHVHRVLIRLGFVGPRATPRAASEAVGAAGYGAPTLLELFAHMKRLGQTHCRFDMPDCAACPLAGGCVTARKGPPALSPRAGLRYDRHIPGGALIRA